MTYCSHLPVVFVQVGRDFCRFAAAWWRLSHPVHAYLPVYSAQFQSIFVLACSAGLFPFLSLPFGSVFLSPLMLVTRRPEAARQTVLLMTC